MKIIPYLLSLILCICAGCRSPHREVIENYEKNSDKLYAAINYYNSIKPTSYDLDIEFPSDETFHLHIRKIDSTLEHNSIFDEYGTYTGRDIPISDLANPEYNEIARISQLNKVRLDSMRYYLLEANCFQIARSNWASDSIQHMMLGYKRSWAIDATLYYLVYDKKLSKPALAKYDESCSFKLINDSVLVEYVPHYRFGNWCFPDKR